MGIEIERKFLVINDSFKKQCFQKSYIKQGFLNSNKNRVVRIRIKDKSAYLTIKGISGFSGLKRYEWEKEISLNEAKELMLLCEEGIIEKYRYFHKVNNHIFEVDEFLEENKGLIIAEIELFDENDPFEKPDYLGKEVTGLKKYFNSNLSKNPFKNWHKKTSN